MLTTPQGVTVYNNLTNFNGTAVHWHGIRMFETNWEDGVPGVTQCPIKVECLIHTADESHSRTVSRHLELTILV
jgi:hypothetical protein